MLVKRIYYDFCIQVIVGNDYFQVQNKSHIRNIINLAWTKMERNKLNSPSLSFNLTTNTLYATCHPDDFNQRDIDIYNIKFTQRFCPDKTSVSVDKPIPNTLFTNINTALTQQTSIIQKSLLLKLNSYVKLLPAPPIFLKTITSTMPPIFAPTTYLKYWKNVLILPKINFM